MTGTVPVNKELLTGTVPVNNLFQNKIEHIWDVLIFLNEVNKYRIGKTIMTNDNGKLRGSVQAEGKNYEKIHTEDL